MKTFTVMLLLSQGVPMICAGDEFGRTQNGNNNAWCQDNQASWLDWSLLDDNSGFHRFFQKCIALRKKHSVFRREEFFQSIDDPAKKEFSPEISWQYLTPGVQNWNPDCHGLAFLLHATTKGKESNDFFVMLNGDKEQTLSFKPPALQERGKSWYQIIDTSADSPKDIFPLVTANPHSEKDCVTIPPFGCIVLQSDF